MPPAPPVLVPPAPPVLVAVPPAPPTLDVLAPLDVGPTLDVVAVDAPPAPPSAPPAGSTTTRPPQPKIAATTTVAARRVMRAPCTWLLGRPRPRGIVDALFVTRRYTNAQGPVIPDRRHVHALVCRARREDANRALDARGRVLIHREVIPRALTYIQQMQIGNEPADDMRPDGALDVPKIMAEWQSFSCEDGQGSGSTSSTAESVLTRYRAARHTLPFSAARRPLRGLVVVHKKEPSFSSSWHPSSLDAAPPSSPIVHAPSPGPSLAMPPSMGRIAPRLLTLAVALVGCTSSLDTHSNLDQLPADTPLGPHTDALCSEELLGEADQALSGLSVACLLIVSVAVEIGCNEVAINGWCPAGTSKIIHDTVDKSKSVTISCDTLRYVVCGSAAAGGVELMRRSCLAI